MIEFKSSCGHTIRARDEDAGKPVRCSYCGEEAKVPSAEEEDLDFLFTEIGGAPDKAAPASSARRGGRPARGRRKGGGLLSNPMELVRQLAYVAGLLIVIIVVAKLFIVPQYWNWRERQRALSMYRNHGYAEIADHPPAAPRSSLGLGTLGGDQGIYVSAVPDSTKVYFIEQDRFRRGERIASMGTCSHAAANSELSVESGKSYAIEVVVAWNDPALTRYPKYGEAFRHPLENAKTDEAKSQLMAGYFQMDGAAQQFVDESVDQKYLVRQYENVRALPGRWTAVHALFIPKDLSVAKLVDEFLPHDEVYGFDADHVLSELDYYRVPYVDRDPIVRALARIGVVPYTTTDEENVLRIRLFKIDIQTGQFAMQVLREIPADASP